MDAAFLRSLLPADAGVCLTAVTITPGLVSLNPPAGETPAAPAAPEPAAPLTGTQQRKVAKRQPREERFRRVKELTAAGLSIRAIGRQLRMGCRAVLRYQRLDRCPDWQAGRTRPSALDPFAAFIADWIAAGNRNSRDLYRVLRAKGFVGGYDAARR